MTNQLAYLVPWLGSQNDLFAPFGIATIIALVLWSLAWKALALWKAAKADSKWWFAALLVINTAGILEILYIYIFSKKATKID